MCVADADESGNVGFADLASVLAGWGPVPDAVHALEVVAR